MKVIIFSEEEFKIHPNWFVPILSNSTKLKKCRKGEVYKKSFKILK